MGSRFAAQTFAALTGVLVATVTATGIISPRGAASRVGEGVTPPTPEAAAFFETKIRPLLAAKCYACHGKEAQLGGLRLDSRAAVWKGGDSGVAVVPGDPDMSLLVRAVRQSGTLKMPQGGRLTDTEIAALGDWVKVGAPFPDAVTPADKARADKKANLWSLKPVTMPKQPAVKNGAWCRSPVDRFVLSRLEQKGLASAPEADRRVLLRRLCYDLVGLPPTDAETAAFLADHAPDAYERQVDRLLASPRYGERMARLWLDVARYADSKGYVFDENRDFPNAYTYRDWVITAFNNDMPYDDFVVRQLAADRLPSAAADLPALGFLTLGRRFLNAAPDIIDDRIDVSMRGLQGFTVACARCHDHKFDPIPTQDYYSLYAVFAAAKETQPAKTVLALEDMPNPGEQHIFKRGNPNNPGDVAPRRFLLALSPKDRPRPEWAGGGRLELARAIASPANPLTARVFVNRVWRWHFGRGIVGTPSDFGHQGEVPTNPELLDYLASAFVKDGWDIKKLHQRIVLSATYRQASRFDARAFAVDPENRLLWRQNRRRLDLEQTRDTLLAASGKLDTAAIGGPSLELWTAPFGYRRAVYGRVDRQNLPQGFRVFDFASPDATNAGRFTTTVPQQSLFFMNAPLVVEQARALAALPEVAGAPNDAARVSALYRRLWGRGATADEKAFGTAFLSAPEPKGAAIVAASPWGYGYGAWDAAVGRLSGFASLPVFAKGQYQISATFPDPVLHYLHLSAIGGHPGDTDAYSPVRRFTAPRACVVSVSGTLIHGQNKGDGVQAALVSGQKVLARWLAFNSRAETSVVRIELRRGDTLDFVVSPGPGGAAFDSFAWSPVVTEIGGTGQVWSAKDGFAAPPETPLSRREQYAQVLLMTNEFLFVD